MESVQMASIDVATAAYDLQVAPEAWLPNLLDKGAPLFDRGLGCAAAIWAGEADDHEPLVAQLCVGAGHDELGLKFARAAQDVGMRLSETSAVREGGARTASEANVDAPSILRAFEKQVGCKDVLGVWGLDPRLHGVGINIPSRQFISLSSRERRRWQRLSLHIAAGHRLRRRLGHDKVLASTPVSELPYEGDALIDPKRFVVTHAAGEAQGDAALEMLRSAALRIDRARGQRGRQNPEEALSAWQALIGGRWSLVDWFDVDGRRFVVAVPNAPGVDDPRGLTKREKEVVELLARGKSSKFAAYELGISRQRVSSLLNQAMRKLGVRTQAQLVLKMKAFGRATGARS
jgi:DNA-binding CsgD family transcriptional regulator